MNQIRAIQALNKREIEAGISPNASWHVDYRDTAFVNFGGLPYELSEGDIHHHLQPVRRAGLPEIEYVTRRLGRAAIRMLQA